MQRNIVIIHKSGGDFRIADVYLLVSHINKYWGEEMQPNIYCYSDTVDTDISVVGLTIRPLPKPEYKGWWSKMNLFSPELQEVRPFLYLDIDTVVLKSIKHLFPPEKAVNEFVALRDFYRPNNLASGLMWIPDAKITDTIYTEWIKGRNQITKKYKGDQNFIEHVIKRSATVPIYWQDISTPEFITTFKPLNQKRRPEWRTEFPDKSAVVCFHGKPRIPEAAKSVDWVKSYTKYEI